MLCNGSALSYEKCEHQGHSTGENTTLEVIMIKNTNMCIVSATLYSLSKNRKLQIMWLQMGETNF